MSSTTPKNIDENVTRLVNVIPDAESPLFLDLEHEPGAKKLDCFGNIRKKISRDGGSIKYGWCVWLWDGKLIEGEFHAVWQSPAGTLHDITPKPDGEHRILFIPDSRLTYNNEPVDNVRVALSDDPEVTEVIEASKRMVELRKRFNDGTGRSKIPFGAILDEFSPSSPVYHSPKAQEAKIGRNDPCPCGSGKKYKKCCL